MEYKWIETTPEVYRAIYSAHKNDGLVVFESYTEMCVENECKLKAQITAWGFKDADHPIIKSTMSDYDFWTYYLLHKETNED